MEDLLQATDGDRHEEEEILWSSCQTVDENSFCFMPSGPDGQVLVVKDHLLYHIKTKRTGLSYWKCHQKGCNFRAMHELQYKNVIKTTGAHNHPIEPGSLRKWKFINSVRMKTLENPQCSPKEIYDTEFNIMKKQISDRSIMSCKAPSYTLVKHFLYHDKKVNSGDVNIEKAFNFPSTISELAGREATEAEREFLDESLEQSPEEVPTMNLSLLSPKLIKSKQFPEICFYFVPSQKGKRILVVNDFTFHLNAQKSGGRFYWRCTVEPCMYRCVYNQEINDIIKVTGKHTHATNIHQLRSREFVHLLKTRLLEDPSLTPKSVYDEELEKLKSIKNGTFLVEHMPAFASIRTTLYNTKNKINFEAAGENFSNNYTSTDLDNEKAQDISPKAITHLSLEDEENMDYDNEDREHSPNQCSSSLEIATPSLYDNHDIIDQLGDGCGKDKKTPKCHLPQSKEELEPNLQTDSRPDPSSYTFTFVPTNRGGQALAVNDCILRSSFVRDSVTYWRCQLKECLFKCSYDSKTNRLLRVSGKHNHPINPWNVHIRSFVLRLKKRLCQDGHLQSKAIYEQEISQLRKEGKNNDFVSKLPSYESLKSALYRVKRPNHIPDCQECTEDFDIDKSMDLPCSQGSGTTRHECPRSSSSDPPQDSVIDTIYAPLDTHIPSWLGQDPERKVVDSHLLMKKSNTDTSTGWICCRKGCLFRCVIDNESKTVLKGKWYHSHRSEVRHIISQTMFNAVKRRVLMTPKLSPKNIYDQEKKRMESKISPNPALLKIIPSYAQVYQLILKTRAKQLSYCKLEKVSNLVSPKQIPCKSTSETQNSPNSNKYLTNSVDNMTDNNYHDGSSKLTSLRNIQDSYPQGERNLSHTQNKSNNCGIEGMPSVEEMEPSFVYEQQSLQQLTSFDYPVGELSLSHESLNGQQALSHESVPVSHFDQGQDLILSGVSISNQANAINANQRSSTSQPHLKHEYLNAQDGEFISTNYHQKNRQSNNNISSQFAPIQDSRISLSNSQSSQQQMVSIQEGHHSLDQPALPVNLGTDLSHETTSALLESFTASTSYIFSSSSQQHNVYPYGITDQSSVDKDLFTLHNYPVFPASAQAGHIYWQCRVSDCHFQCVYNVVTGQMVRISGNHNHQPPSSQQALLSQVTKMLLRKAVENLDKPIYDVYWDYMKALYSLLDSESIFNSLPRYEDVMEAMQNARVAMGINSETNTKTMFLKPQAVQVHGTETYPDFSLDSENNRLILHGEEMVFLWRKNEIIHWKCKQSDCRFKCVYDEEIQSLHVLSNHSPHCSSKSGEIYRGPASKRRHPNPNEAFTRLAKCPRIDQ